MGGGWPAGLALLVLLALSVVPMGAGEAKFLVLAAVAACVVLGLAMRGDLGAPPPAVVVPLLLLARISRTVFRKRCRVGKFIVALPLLTVALLVLVAGEWVGCVLGPGDALSKVE